MTTIRTASFSGLIRSSETRCPSCSSLKISLNVMPFRGDNYDHAVKKDNTPYIRMMRGLLSTKVTFLQSKRRSHRKNINKFEAKIAMLIRNEGVLVNENIDKVLEKVIYEKVAPDFDENSPKYLLWEQQKKMNKLKWNEMAPSCDQMVFECLFEVSR